ncbi:MAG: hypothetical protein JW881_02910 [Spirochaetales bacterium]|nr:hypothetical protein [Spirochaetales bacterium]
MKMKTKNNKGKQKRKLLLTCVFKPYGVDDAYGEALCSMELLNNQVTREQGIHSPRFNNLSFGLYLLAENIGVPTTVIDFPSWKNFTREVKKGNYSHIGITFIAQNILRVKRMVAYIRRYSPESKIIVGGHGTSIPELRDIIDYDDICRGEGVVWLRGYFGENTDKPIIHPTIQISVNSYIYGAPLIEKAGTIIPGVGCQNGCRFCATSHKFEKKYTPFLDTGHAIFDACHKAENELNVTTFGLMDENFCQNDIKARQLLEKMEKYQKTYTFQTFSSARAVTDMGVDFLVRMGVNFIWIGVESKAGLFDKTKGIDLHALIADLQNHGITVLASSILFLEHHDKKTIHEDIDWAIGLESDLLQFMLFGPVPGTPLFEEYTSQGKMIEDYPWQSRHGQGTLWFHHPHFTLPETSVYLKNAFLKKYLTHGPGIINMAHTAIKSYLIIKKETEFREARGLVWDRETLRYREHHNSPQPDHYMGLRLKELRKNALRFRPVLYTAMKYCPNKKSEEKIRAVIELYDTTFGPPSPIDRILDIIVRISAIFEQYRFRKNGVVMRQPPFLRTVYNHR